MTVDAVGLVTSSSAATAGLANRLETAPRDPAGNRAGGPVVLAAGERSQRLGEVFIDRCTDVPHQCAEVPR